MKQAKDYIYFDKRESTIESIISNLTTFSMLGFCAWVSKGSTFWTLITGLLFIFFLIVALKKIVSERMYEFKTKKELIEWAEENLED